MPGVLAPVTYEPIKAVRVASSQGATPQLFRAAEKATGTFQIGVPVKLNGGYVDECSFTGAQVVYGVSAEKAHNLTVDGTAQGLNDAGPPPNQASAIIEPIGAMMRDGKLGVYAANGQTIFSIALKATQVFTQALMVAGTYYGITKDAGSGFWYLDNTDTTGDNAVAELVGLDESSPNTAAGGCRVFFRFRESLRFWE